MNNRRKLAIFGGTTEGRLLAERLLGTDVAVDVFVATEYGREELPSAENLRVLAGRLDLEEMEKTLLAEGYEAVLDATHPYARLVSENLRAAGKRCGIPVLRIVREETGEAPETGKTICVDSVAQAVEFLKGTEGNILAATGSKELSAFLALPDWENRVFARVLSLPEVVENCAKMGFYGKHLLAMEGPFSAELNAAMLKSVDARWMVTKESGRAGGFLEKVQGARLAGAGLLVIGRPKEEGLSLKETFSWLEQEFGVSAPCRKMEGKRKLFLVGAGPGSEGLLTQEAREALSSCQLLCGAKRCVKQLSSFGKTELLEYRPEAILRFLEDHPEYETIAVALSGDTGFYSGAGPLLKVFGDRPEYSLEVVPGISSLSLFFAKLGRSWEGVRLCSMHGREADIGAELRAHGQVFFLAGEPDVFSKIAAQARAAGLSGVRLTVGENLSLPGERIFSGTAEALSGTTASPLTVVLAEWDGFSEKERRPLTHGLRDEEFLRGPVPMTKMEVRTVSLAKLGLCEGDLLFDVGAGTGSVSVECARLSDRIRVIAIERNPEAADLLRKNREKFGLSNLELVEGEAPDCLKDLPAPSHVFIGGSGGRMKETVRVLLAKNPGARFVVNLITPESLGTLMETVRELPVEDFELVSLAAARSRAVGTVHLMTGQNPVWIASFRGRMEKKEGESGWENGIQ